MPLFLVTNVCDEGLYDTSFRVVEAPSRLAVALYILRNPEPWKWWLQRSHLWEGVADGRWTADQLLERIDRTHVDGDSDFQFAIHELKTIERCDAEGRTPP